MANVIKKVAGLEFVANLPTKIVGGIETVSARDARAMEIRVARELIDRGIVKAAAFAFIRKVAKLKAAQVALFLDVDEKTVSRWETGDVAVPRPSWATLALLFHERVNEKGNLKITSIL